MKTVLVISSSHDIIVDYLIAIYSKRCTFFRLDLDRLADYNFQLNQYGWSIDNYKEFITDKTVDAIYYRKPNYPNYRKYDEKYQSLMKKDINTLIQGITNSFDGKCLSKPALMESAENKIYQMCLAKKVGLTMPDSLITNNSRCIEKFSLNNNCIIKSFSLELKNTKLEPFNFLNINKYLEGLEICPTYFEHYITSDYKVITNFIGEKSYTVRIDIKNKKNNEKRKKYSSIELPKEIEAKCLSFMKEINMDFGAFDFIVENGEYYFLGFNPDAQWLGFENEFSWDLSAEIIKYLC